MSRTNRPALLFVAIAPLLFILQSSHAQQATKSASQDIPAKNKSSSTTAGLGREAQSESSEKQKIQFFEANKTLEFLSDGSNHNDYQWTTSHMHVGVRWQPYGGRPVNNAYDASRPVISKYSSYAQFWVAWSASEPSEESTDYAQHMSDYLKTIEQAVDACVAQGLKCEFVFWHSPAWAAVGGKAGGVQAKPGHYSAFVERIARHFKGRVHAYQLAHEANLKMHLNDGDMDYMISEVFTNSAT